MWCFEVNAALTLSSLFPLTFIPIELGGVQSTRRYRMLMRPRAMGLSLSKTRAWMSMWSAPHSGHESVMVTVTLLPPPSRQRPLNSLPSTHWISQHVPHAEPGMDLKYLLEVAKAATWKGGKGGGG